MKALSSHEVRFCANPGPLIPNTSVGSKENTHDPFYYRLIVTVLSILKIDKYIKPPSIT